MPDADIILIEGGDVYAPEPLGQVTLLIAGGKIRRLGSVDRSRIAASGLELEVIDAGGCFVWPGLIDVHEHLIGGSGESGGFSTQSPEIFLSELLEAGITTVVGCLGTDNVTKTMPALLAKVKALREQGISGYAYSGGYSVPPATLTGSIRNDILLIEEVIGAGEIAISDRRSSAPSLAELARIARECYTAGMLSGKAGVLHFHVGEESTQLSPVRELLEQHHVRPETVYPTHVERNESLFDEAVELSRRGVTVDADVVEEDLPHWVRRFMDRGGDLARMTASSDAALTRPALLLEQVFRCAESNIPLEIVLPLVSSNPARALRLDTTGTLEPGKDGDVLVVDRGTRQVRDLLSRGRVLVRGGQHVVRQNFIASSNRRVQFYGEKK